MTAVFTAFLSLPVFAQAVKRAAFDVTHYTMDVALSPGDRKMTATVDVIFVPQEETRSVAFELNGSLKVDSITRVGSGPALPAGNLKTAPKGAPASTVTFVQDQTNSTDLGPHVRVDLGDTVTNGTPVTLRFKYSGILDGPAGGPLLTKRLAFVGDNLGYLMYAARWFPFHNYAADEATSEITISLPSGYQVIGYSDTPVAATGGKYHFVNARPSLPGNFAYGKFTVRPMTVNGQELQFFAKPGTDAQIASGRDELREEMNQQRRDRFFSAYMQKAKTNLKININQDMLAQVLGGPGSNAPSPAPIRSSGRPPIKR